MSIKDIFKKRKQINEDFERINHELVKLYAEDEQLKKDCPHSLVVLFSDDGPRKKLIEGTCFCPACNLKLQIVKKEHLKKSVFRKSEIIDVRKLSLIANSETLNAIRDEIYNNIGEYINLPLHVLEDRMTSVLSPYEVKFEDKVLKRQLK